MNVLAATFEGLFLLDGGRNLPDMAGRDVSALARDGSAWWCIVDGRSLFRGTSGRWAEAAGSDHRLNCVCVAGAGVFVGAARAMLLRLANGRLETVESFGSAPGRGTWFTPWGGPPDVRTIAASDALYVNVHVGGILRSADGGRTWEPTIHVAADVHEVVAPTPTRVVAATARGLAESDDSGATWTFTTAGLHASYGRAVAVCDEVVLMSASTGPRGERAAVYRRERPGAAFARCTEGLPEWFADNIDSGCLAGAGAAAAVGTSDGRVFVSDDRGRTWRRVAGDLPPVRAVALFGDGAR